jgi:valyl-tRNA synthetase
MFDKTYKPAAAEARQYARWEASGGFAADPAGNATPWAIMMPPPNVTGSLHIGHALTFTLQDVLVRYRRMQGRDVLWQPGTDHAGIATEIVVGEQLAAAGSTKTPSAATGLSTECGSGKSSQAAPLPASFAALARRPIGTASASRWMRGLPPRYAGYLSRSITRG